MDKGENDKEIKKAVVCDKEKDEYHCMICANVSKYVASGACDHLTCTTCSLRLRFKENDKLCPICKQTQEYVICYDIRKGTKSFASFNVWSIDTPTPGFDIDYQTSMLYAKCSTHYKEMIALRSILCPFKKCKEQFSSNESLQQHLKDKHDKSFCHLCLIHRPIFISEQMLYTSTQLKKHMIIPYTNKKDKKQQINYGQINGHPLCRFCNQHYYDNSELYKHMRSEHMTCHLCPSQHQHRFYANSTSLLSHCRDAHIVCPHCTTQEILENGVEYAFRSYYDLNQHLLNIHRISTGQNTRLNLAVGFMTKTPNNDLRLGPIPFLDMDWTSRDPNRLYQEYSSEDDDEINGDDTRKHNKKNEKKIGNKGKSSHNNRETESYHNTTTSMDTSSTVTSLIPPHMKIAGRVTGNGLFQYTDDDNILQQLADETAAEQQRIQSYYAAAALTRIQQNDDVNFPKLGSEVRSVPLSTSNTSLKSLSSSTQTTVKKKTSATREKKLKTMNNSKDYPDLIASTSNQTKHTSVDVDEGDEEGEGGYSDVKGKKSSKNKNTLSSSVSTNTLSAILSSVDTSSTKPKSGTNNTNNTGNNANSSGQVNGKLSRTMRLADAFGIETQIKDIVKLSTNSNSNTNSGGILSSNSTNSSTNTDMEILYQYLLSHTHNPQQHHHHQHHSYDFFQLLDSTYWNIQIMPKSMIWKKLELFLRPLYLPCMITYAKNMRNDLLKVEKKIYDLITTTKSNSIQLKPMPPGPRYAICVLAKYYQVNAYEYDQDPKRYVSLVKSAQSHIPILTLSAATAMYTAGPILIQPPQMKLPYIYIQIKDGINAFYPSSSTSSMTYPDGSMMTSSFQSIKTNYFTISDILMMLYQALYQSRINTQQATYIISMCTIVDIKPLSPSTINFIFKDVSSANYVYTQLQTYQAPVHIYIPPGSEKKMKQTLNYMTFTDLFQIYTAFDPVDTTIPALDMTAYTATTTTTTNSHLEELWKKESNSNITHGYDMLQDSQLSSVSSSSSSTWFHPSHKISPTLHIHKSIPTNTTTPSSSSNSNNNNNTSMNKEGVEKNVKDIKLHTMKLDESFISTIQQEWNNDDDNNNDDDDDNGDNDDNDDDDDEKIVEKDIHNNNLERDMTILSHEQDHHNIKNNIQENNNINSDTQQLHIESDIHRIQMNIIPEKTNTLSEGKQTNNEYIKAEEESSIVKNNTCNSNILHTDISTIVNNSSIQISLSTSQHSSIDNKFMNKSGIYRKLNLIPRSAELPLLMQPLPPPPINKTISNENNTIINSSQSKLTKSKSSKSQKRKSGEKLVKIQHAFKYLDDSHSDNDSDTSEKEDDIGVVVTAVNDEKVDPLIVIDKSNIDINHTTLTWTCKTCTLINHLIEMPFDNLVICNACETQYTHSNIC